MAKGASASRDAETPQVVVSTTCVWVAAAASLDGSLIRMGRLCCRKNDPCPRGLEGFLLLGRHVHHVHGGPALHGPCARGRQRRFSHLVMLPPPPIASGVSEAGVEDWNPALAAQSFGLTFDWPGPVLLPWLAFKGQEPSSVMYWELMKPGPCSC